MKTANTMNINPLHIAGFCMKSIKKLKTNSKSVTLIFFRVLTELSAFPDLIRIIDKVASRKTNTKTIISSLPMPSFSNPNSLNINVYSLNSSIKEPLK